MLKHELQKVLLIILLRSLLIKIIYTVHKLLRYFSKTTNLYIEHKDLKKHFNPSQTVHFRKLYQNKN